MKKTLLICGHYPLPENIGTNIRTMNIVRFFLQYGSVDIAFSHIDPETESNNHIFSNEYCLKRESSAGYMNYLYRFITGLPLPIHNYCNTSENLLFSIIQSNTYDYIFVRYILNTSSLLKLPVRYRMRTMIDFDDILSGPLYETFVGMGKGFYKRFLHDINKKLLIKYEKKFLNFGASLFCSETDKKMIVDGDRKANAFVVPNIYHNESFRDYHFGDGFKNGNTLLFIGTLNYKPNADGLKWFIASFYQDFIKRHPDAKLLIVGRYPTDDIIKLCRKWKGIELYGNVPDVKDYYQQCRAVIVPLLTGSGTRIKILEAALADRPILSTPLGAAGLNLKDDLHVLFFERPDEFLSQYNKLFNKAKYASLVGNAKDHVVSYYSLERFNGTMKKVLHELDNRQCSYYSK